MGDVAGPQQEQGGLDVRGRVLVQERLELVSKDLGRAVQWYVGPGKFDVLTVAVVKALLVRSGGSLGRHDQFLQGTQQARVVLLADLTRLRVHHFFSGRFPSVLGA